MKLFKTSSNGFNIKNWLFKEPNIRQTPFFFILWREKLSARRPDYFLVKIAHLVTLMHRRCIKTIPEDFLPSFIVEITSLLRCHRSHFQKYLCVCAEHICAQKCAFISGCICVCACWCRLEVCGAARARGMLGLFSSWLDTSPPPHCKQRDFSLCFFSSCISLFHSAAARCGWRGIPK